MNEILEFLNARLDEDELIARQAFDTREDWVAMDVGGSRVVLGVSGARTLREVRAKRLIVSYLETVLAGCRVSSDPEAVWRGDDAEITLRTMVLAYSGHAEFRWEWDA